MTDAPHTAPTSTVPGIRAHVPNVLTMGRLVLAGGFVAVLSMYAYEGDRAWLLPVASALFVIAAITDALDGHLARRWGVVSRFGRIMDPFADKVLVLSAFILLAGPGFRDSAGNSVSGMEAWMAILILARELLVTSIRGALETSGISFGASAAGKLKMVLQSVAAPAILLIVWRAAPASLSSGWARRAVVALVWATIGVTVVSALPYVVRAARSVRAHDGSGS